MESGASALSIDSGLEMGTKLLGWVMDTISGNEILATVLVVGLLIPAGIGIFKYVKSAVKH
ncbi:MAG: hypothetical protein E7264_00795 [Lachnospiraceae bacterium]|nr:hypothetical protein [Lachnospiraceae bacterium]